MPPAHKLESTQHVPVIWQKLDWGLHIKIKNKTRKGRETQKSSFRPGRVLLLGLLPLPPLVDVIGAGKLGSWCGLSLMLLLCQNNLGKWRGILNIIVGHSDLFFSNHLNSMYTLE